ncbi:hypothetical protein P3S67_001812 [Capsicum chacoense]
MLDPIKGLKVIVKFMESSSRVASKPSRLPLVSKTIHDYLIRKTILLGKKSEKKPIGTLLCPMGIDRGEKTTILLATHGHRQLPVICLRT